MSGFLPNYSTVDHFAMLGPHTNVRITGAHTNRRKIAENGAARGGHAVAVVWPRAWRTLNAKNRSKPAELPGKARPVADLRGSAEPPRVTHSFTNQKIKLRRPR